MFLISSLLFMDIRYFWPVLGIPFYVPMPTGVILVSVAILSLVLGLEGVNRLYPYVEIRRVRNHQSSYVFFSFLLNLEV